MWHTKYLLHSSSVPRRLRPDLHPDEDAARRALERLVRAKCRRGYREAA